MSISAVTYDFKLLGKCHYNKWGGGGGGGGGGGKGASEQLGNSFGSITPSFPMKVIGGLSHSSGRKSQASLSQFSPNCVNT